MRRLAPFLLAALVASFPPTVVLVLLGGLATTAGPSVSVHHHGDVGGFHHPHVVAALPTSYSYSNSHRTVAASVVSAMGYVAASSPADASVGNGGSGKPLQPQLQPIEPMPPEASTVAGAPTPTAEAPPPDARALKVSVVGASRGRSDDCTYSMVSFENTHDADTLVVYSAYIEPTVVFPPNWTSAEPPHLPTDGPLPTPVYLQGYEGRRLELPPQSRTTVPVSIIPAYRKPPDPARDYSSRSSGKGGGSLSESADDRWQSDATNITETSVLSPASHADILDMLANYRRESNRSAATNGHNRSRLPIEGTVHETLVAYTNWGVVQMRVPYVCVPPHVASPSEYEVGLPNNLMFLDAGGGWYARRNTTPTVELAYLFGDMDSNPMRDKFDPFVYRVYMNNPTEGELRIWDVRTTKPNVVGVEMQKNLGTSTTSSLSRMNDVKHYYPFRGQSHPPKHDNIYVATVRLLPTRFTQGMMFSKRPLDLGFVVVRTNVGTFSIALDFIPGDNVGGGGVIHGVPDNVTRLDDVHLVRDNVVDELLKEAPDRNPPNVTIVKSFRAKDADKVDRVAALKDAIQSRLEHIEALQNGTMTSSTYVTRHGTPLLNATPSSINFGSITAGSRVVRIPVKLGNPNELPLRIMRISVAMSTVSDDGGNTTDISNERNGMEIGVDFTDGSPMTSLGSDWDGGVDSLSTKKETFAFPHDFVLPPSTDQSHTIYVWCRFNASPSNSVSDVKTTVLPRFYTGSLIVQATEDMYVPYKEWEEQLLLDHYLGGNPSPSLLQRVSSSPVHTAKVQPLQIPFEGSVLPGNLGAPTESLLYPRAFYVLSEEERVKILAQQGSSASAPEYLDRELDITNNFAVPITITGMKILDSNMDDFCTSRFSPSMAEHAMGPTANTGEMWKGLSVRYHFRDEDNLVGITNVKCILSIETDKAGKQSLPLIVYSGEVIVDVERPDGGQLTVHCIVSRDGHHVVSRSGMPCMKDWMKVTLEGGFLGTFMSNYFVRKLQASKKASRGRQCAYSGVTDVDASSLYFQSLLAGANASPVTDEEAPRQDLQPVVVSFGAIATGESTSSSILLTNMNHVPVQISATTAALGNMNVTMGVLPVNIREFFHETRHPPAKWDEAHFLHHSPVAKKLFGKFKHTLDIEISPRLQTVPLRHEYVSLFQRYAESHHFSNATEYLAGYVAEEESAMNSKCACGYVISTDYSYDREICTRQAGKKHWTIPPGGVARFMVTVQAPPRSELKNDVTSFVGTGLVLETNHGQAFPLVLTYSAVSGQVSISSGASGENSTDSAVDSKYEANHVPLTFKDPTITPSVDTFAQRHGVPVEIESSFSQSIYLSEIRSCNKWFNVFLPANYPAAREFFASKGKHFIQIDAPKGAGGDESKAIVPLGKVLSALSCNHPSGDTSFWACALAWLENRSLIQAVGCGLTEMEIAQSAAKTNVADDDPAILESKLAQTKGNAIGALRDVVAFLSVRYASANATELGANSGESQSSGGYVHFSRMHMFDHVRETWNAVANAGLNILTGHIDAKTLYFPENKSMDEMVSIASEAGNAANVTQMQHSKIPLSIPVASMLLKSSLDIPKLFYDPRDSDALGTVDFDTVHVADVSTRMVPIVNPTATTIRVKLAAVEYPADGTFVSAEYSDKSQSVFVQGSSSDRHPWWTGGGYWMSSSDSDGDGGHLMSASHNVTIKSGAGAYVSLLNPALHAMNAFILGCGKRCGLRNEVQDQQGSSAFGGEEKNYSPIGAGSGGDSVLFGRSYECDKSSGECPSTMMNNDKADERSMSPEKILSMADPPAFSLGRGVAHEVVIPPYGRAELGPVYFRPPGRGLYQGSVYIENSLTGFEEVKVSGRGGWEMLVFLDQPLSDDEGGDVEFRFGQSALVFSGSNGVGSGENSGPVVKAVRLANQEDVPVDVSRVYMASSEVMHFTHKRQHTMPKSTAADRKKKCSARGFVLPGCRDSHSNVWMQTLSDWRKFIVKILPDRLKRRKTEEEISELIAEFYADRVYKKGFTLQPNETKSVYVAHYPDCTFQTSYASVIFEIGDRSQAQTSSRGRVGSWQQTFRQQKMELLVGYDMSATEYRTCVPYSPPEATVMERKLQIQLPKLIVDYGKWKAYMHRVPIEVTIFAATFVLLLIVLAFDLLFTVEISTNRKSCPSWIPTCRCLARADPTSSDLASIGKEQTKHVLLSRFKKEGVLPSHCILSDGSFRREKKAGGGAGGTHSEAIFAKSNLVSESMMTEEDDDERGGDAASGLLPCGLGWRTALRRGVGLPSSAKNDRGVSPELQYLTRTRDQYLKKQRQQKLKLANAPASTPTKARNIAAANGVPASKPVAESVTAPLPQDRTIGERQIRKNVQSAANGGNASALQQKASSHAANASKATAKAATNGNPPIADTSSGKLKQQQQKEKKVAAAAAEAKAKKARDEPKDAKTARANTTADAKKDAKQEPAKPLAEKKIKKKPSQERATAASTKELVSTQAKQQSKQSKKAANGAKVTEPQQTKAGKQANKLKGAKKQATAAKATPKSPSAQRQRTRSSNDAEFPPLSGPQSPTQKKKKKSKEQQQQQQAKAGNVSRPPPGLLAPPGFVGQPDPTSPTPSPTRASVPAPPMSPVVQPLPGADIIPSPTPQVNSDLTTLLTPHHLESSLFQTQLDSPQPGSEGGGLLVPQLLPQSFSPPLVESSTAETSDVQDLLGAGSNFNVSNFLDGILSDSVPPPPLPAKKEPAPTPAAEVADPMGFGAMGLGASLNPWDSSETSSAPTDSNRSSSSTNPLAALRGASETSNADSFIAGIPLSGDAPSLFATATATTTLQGSGNSETTATAVPVIASVVSEGEDEDDLLEPDSFYSNLLGGE